MLNRGRFETIALLGITGCLVALGSACSSQKSGAGQDAGAPDASSDLVTTGVVWNDQSRAIDVGCFAFFEGSKRIRATRDQLTAEQLAILSNLVTTSPNNQCYEDTTACTVAITATDGTVATYRAEQFDSGCDQPGPMISFASLSPFLQAVPCLSAKQGLLGPADAGPITPSVVPDAICWNGVFASPPQTVQRLLVVADPSIPRHLELDSCNNQYRSPAQVHPQLLAADGVTSLSVGTTVTDPGPDQTCWRLDYTFAAAGTYQLDIGLDQGFEAGDFFLRFY